MDIDKILDLFGLDSEESSGGWIRIQCPFRRFDHKSAEDEGNFVFGIHPEKDTAHCFVCDHISTIGACFSFLALLLKRPDLYKQIQKICYSGIEDKKLKGVLKKAQYRFFQEKEDTHLLDLQKAWFDRVKKSGGAKKYLQRRGFSEEDSEYLIETANLKFDTKESRLLIPHYDYHTKEFLGTEGRSVLKVYTKKTKNYLGSRISDSFLYLPTGITPKAFIIVEGPFDLFKLQLLARKENYDYTVLCLSGSRATDKMVAILDRAYLPVFLLTDNDEAGAKVANKLEFKLKGKVPLFHKLDLPKGRNDPDECTDEELSELLQLINIKLGTTAIDCKERKV